MWSFSQEKAEVMTEVTVLLVPIRDLPEDVKNRTPNSDASKIQAVSCICIASDLFLGKARFL